MPLYLDGIKDGSNIESWAADMFFLDEQKSIKATKQTGIITLIDSGKRPPLDTKLSLKQLKEYGFTPWLGAKPQSDYYILRQY